MQANIIFIFCQKSFKYFLISKFKIYIVIKNTFVFQERTRIKELLTPRGAYGGGGPAGGYAPCCPAGAGCLGGYPGAAVGAWGYGDADGG